MAKKTSSPRGGKKGRGKPAKGRERPLAPTQTAPVKNRGKTGQGRFQAGTSGNPRGRPRGAKGKVTVEAQAACAAIIDDPIYRAKLLAAAQARELPPGIEALLWYYAKGKPQERVHLTGGDELIERLARARKRLQPTDA